MFIRAFFDVFYWSIDIVTETPRRLKDRVESFKRMGGSKCREFPRATCDGEKYARYRVNNRCVRRFECGVKYLYGDDKSNLILINSIS